MHCVGEVELEGGLSALDVSPAGGYCLAGSPLGELVLLDANGAVCWRAGLADRIVGACCSRDGEYSVAITGERLLAVFDRQGSRLWDKKLRHEAGCIDLRPGSNMIAIGNRYRYLRCISIHGKRVDTFEATHPIDFVRFAPSGMSCALASEDGVITLIEFSGKTLWTVMVHRTLIGLDVSHNSGTVIAPTRSEGIVVIEARGETAGVYRSTGEIAAAEIDDDYGNLFALSEIGTLLVFDCESGLLKEQIVGQRADRLAVDGGGRFLAVASHAGKLEIYQRSDESIEREDFVELRLDNPRMRVDEEDDSVRYLDI